MCDAVKQHENVIHELINALCMLVMDVSLIYFFSSLLLFVCFCQVDVYKTSFNHEHC